MKWNPVSLISRKRDGHELTEGEILALIEGFTNERVPDYQMAAFAMATFFQGMSESETVALTRAMQQSGKQLVWPSAKQPIVDKHSTGGVGDKVSLPLAPLLACCDVLVPMISGRGLGPTGGTLDKLESIPGYRTDLPLEEFQRITLAAGCSISGASDDLAPADRKLYALRDVTGTVPSIPLITASILSKKLSEGLDALQLDVKWGSGAFMKSREGARKLANSLVTTASQLGVPTGALVTDMNQPLGRMIGNSVEIDESIDVLRGEGPSDLVELTVELGSELLVLSKSEVDLASARSRIRGVLENGTGHERFARMVHAHGGDINAPRQRARSTEVAASRDGYIQEIDTERLGQWIVDHGGGRRKKGDSIDHSVGMEILAKLGEKVERGQPLFRVFVKDSQAAAAVGRAVTIGEERRQAPELFADRVSESS